jgi:two-component system, OmpR family, response regulator TctD
MRILLVEDEVELATWLIKALTQSGFAVEWSNDGVVADRVLLAQEFDALILDLSLPSKSGYEVLRSLRDRDDRIPVLILTARDSLAERVNSLRQGADDFLPKPFAVEELEARVYALIRRSQGRERPRLSCGPLSFDIANKQFLLFDKPLSLTPREFAMLTTLIQRVGEPISKERLLDRVFGDRDEVNLEATEVLVYRLRKKLTGTVVRIVTMRGFGYVLEVGPGKYEYA